jgi:hypothetical protein
MAKTTYVYEQTKYGEGLLFVKAEDRDHAKTKLMSRYPQKNNYLNLIGDLKTFLNQELFESDKDIVDYTKSDR